MKPWNHLPHVRLKLQDLILELLILFLHIVPLFPYVRELVGDNFQLCACFLQFLIGAILGLFNKTIVVSLKALILLL
jgi:hypothetical protein